MANKHMEYWSTSLIIREIQIETTMKCHSISARMGIKKRDNNKQWQRCREIEHSYVASGNIKCAATVEKFGISSKS